MNKKEFVNKAEKLGIYSVPREEKELIGKKAYYFLDEKSLDLYGVYKDKDKKYIIFYKASERGIFKIIDECKSEEEAWDKLYEDIKK